MGGVATKKKVIAEFFLRKSKTPTITAQKKRQLSLFKIWLSLWSQRFGAHFGGKTLISSNC